MKTKIYGVVALLGLGLVYSAQGAAPKALYKVTKLSQSQVGISCLNGADPTGRKIGDLVIMSCENSPETDIPATPGQVFAKPDKVFSPTKESR